VVFGFKPSDVKMNSVGTFVLEVLGKAVGRDTLSNAILSARPMIVSHAEFSAEYFKHIGIFSPALATECVRSLCSFGDAKLDDHAITALLPTDDIALGKNAGFCDSQFGALGTREIGIREIGIREIGTREIGIREIGIREIGTREIGTREIGTREIGIHEIGIREIGTREIGTREIGTREIGTRLNGAFNRETTLD
jgi:hypothetical protein